MTILHRLNGLKIHAITWTLKEDLSSIASLDEAFKISKEVHTNVIAGLALEDGHTIAAWLPEAEAEMPPPAIQYAPAAPATPRTPGPPTPNRQRIHRRLKSLPLRFRFSRDPLRRQLTEAGRPESGYQRWPTTDGTLPWAGRVNRPFGDYPGQRKPGAIRGAEEDNCRSRSTAPCDWSAACSPLGSQCEKFHYVRIGQTDATVINLNRSPSGGVARIKIKSNKLSAANIGGIAINEDGETLGIVDSVNGTEATIVPLAMVRSAAKRVVARQASVPRPWLGIRASRFISCR